MANNNNNISKNNALASTRKPFNPEEVTRLLESTGQTINAAKDTVIVVTDRLDEYDKAFARENMPYLDEAENELLKTAWERKEITTAEVLDNRRKIRREHLEETERIHNLRNAQIKTRGEAILKAGIGIGIGGIGIALIKAIFNGQQKDTNKKS